MKPIGFLGIRIWLKLLSNLHLYWIVKCGLVLSIFMKDFICLWTRVDVAHSI